MADVAALQESLLKLRTLAISELAAGWPTDQKSVSHASGVKQAIVQCVRDLFVAQRHGALKALRCRGSFLFPYLPRPVLLRIMGFLDVGDCIALSRTCRPLHDACMDIPAFRPSISVRERSTEDLEVSSWALERWDSLRAFLRRSHSTPSVNVYIPFEIPPLHRDEIIGLVREAISVAGMLRLDLFSDVKLPINELTFYTRAPASPEEWDAASSLLCQPLPLLSVLQLVIHQGSFGPWEDPEADILHRTLSPHILGGEPGNLRRCILRWVAIPIGGASAFSLLRTLDFTPPGRCLTSSQVINILKSLPRLEILGIVAPYVKVDTNVYMEKHPSLSRVIIQIWHDAATIDGLSFFAQLSVPTLYIVDVAGTLEWDDFRHVFKAPEQLRVASDHNGMDEIYDMLLPGTSCQQLWLRATQGRDLARLSKSGSMFANLTSLTIHEMLWCIRTPEHPAPLLSRLHIVFYHDMSWLYARWLSGVFGLSSLSPWDCPLLKEISFSFYKPGTREPAYPLTRAERYYDQDTCHGTIALSDVATFIRTAVRFDAPRLHRVDLYGISAVADSDPAAEFIALQQLTDAIELHGGISPEAHGLLDMTGLERGLHTPPCLTDIFDPLILPFKPTSFYLHDD